MWTRMAANVFEDDFIIDCFDDVMDDGGLL